MNQDASIDLPDPATFAKTKHGVREVNSSCELCESLELNQNDGSDAPSLSDLSECGVSENNAVGEDPDDILTGDKCRKQNGETHHVYDDQREVADEDEAVSSCSSLSVDASKHLPPEASDGSVSEGCDSLSLSLSTESDAAAIGLVLYSSEAEASTEEDHDAKFRVFLPDEEADRVDEETPLSDSVDASSLSGERSSFSVEVQYVDCEEGEEESLHDDDLWRAFDTALQTRETNAPSPLLATPTTIQSPAFLTFEDDGYDGSASEGGSVSSLEESLEGTDDPIFYSGMRIDHVMEMGSVDEGGIKSGRVSSSISGDGSSLLSSVESTESHDLHSSVANSLSVSEEERDSRLWIENIPVLHHPSNRVSTTLPTTREAEYANYWAAHEYVKATAGHKRPRHLHQRRWSDESLTLEGEDGERQSWSDEDMSHAFVTPSPTRKAVSIQYEHLQARESYVSYIELAGIIESHVPGRSGLCVDLGCGTSRVCEELVFHGYNHVLGMDKDLSAIAFQRQQPAALQLPEYLRFLPMEASSSLLLPDRCCDLILSNATLDEIAARSLREQIPQKLVKTLQESIRCLKPGGVLMAVVYQENLLEVNDADHYDEGWPTAEARVAARLITPWWQWSEIQSVLDRHLTLVHQCELGRPRMVSGTKTAPYKALVWRKNETDRERLRRLAGNLLEAKQQQCEYETRVCLWQSQQERAQEESRVVRESRQMILEDERGRCARAVSFEAEAMRVRQHRRKAFYAALVEDEKRHMRWEDAAAKQRRAVELDIKEFVVETVLQIVVIEKALKLALAKQALAERAKQGDDAGYMTIEKSKIKAAVSDKRLRDGTWVEEEILRIVDAAVASVVPGDTSEVLPQRNDPSKVSRPAETEQFSTPVVKTLDKESEDLKTAASATVAADAAAWIVLAAVDSLTSINPPSNADTKTDVGAAAVETIGVIDTTSADHNATKVGAEGPLPVELLVAASHEEPTDRHLTAGVTEEVTAQAVSTNRESSGEVNSGNGDWDNPSNSPHDAVQMRVAESVDSSKVDLVQACKEAMEFMLEQLLKSTQESPD